MNEKTADRLRKLADQIDNGDKKVRSFEFDAELRETEPFDGIRAYEPTGVDCYYLVLED